MAACEDILFTVYTQPGKPPRYEVGHDKARDQMALTWGWSVLNTSLSALYQENVRLLNEVNRLHGSDQVIAGGE